MFRNRKSMVLSSITVVSVLLTGCATKADIEGLRKQIEMLSASSNEALENSREARNIANDSASKLDVLKLDLADVRESSELNQQKLDSVFEKSMLK